MTVAREDGLPIGLAFPLMTEEARNNIPSPPEGMMLMNRSPGSTLTVPAQTIPEMQMYIAPPGDPIAAPNVDPTWQTVMTQVKADDTNPASAPGMCLPTTADVTIQTLPPCADGALVFDIATTAVYVSIASVWTLV